MIRELASRLAAESGNGFSKSNLEYLRRFYLAYQERGSRIAQTLSGQFYPSQFVRQSLTNLLAPQFTSLSPLLAGRTGSF